MPNLQGLALGLLGITVIGIVLFVVRQRRATNPPYDLEVAARPTFWVAAVAGIIVFGSLMGILFINQQYLQNVLDCGTLAAGLAIVPAAVMMIVVAPRSATLVHQWGSRATLLLGQAFLALAFVTMLFLWGEGTPYWVVVIPLLLMGVGVGFAQTPSSNSLTASVPIRRVGMASGTNPEHGDQIIAAARSSFLEGDSLAYAAGLVAVIVGAAVVFLRFPNREEEDRVHATYFAQDQATATSAATAGAGATEGKGWTGC